MNSLRALKNKEASLKEKIERVSKLKDDPRQEETLERAKAGLAEVQEALRNHHSEKGKANEKPSK